jgi:hypothetical protein
VLQVRSALPTLRSSRLLKEDGVAEPRASRYVDRKGRGGKLLGSKVPDGQREHADMRGRDAALLGRRQCWAMRSC